MSSAFKQCETTSDVLLLTFWHPKAQQKGAAVELCAQFLHSRDKKATANCRDTHAKTKLRITAMTNFQLLQSLSVFAVHKKQGHGDRLLLSQEAVSGDQLISSPLGVARLCQLRHTEKNTSTNFLPHRMRRNFSSLLWNAYGLTCNA